MVPVVDLVRQDSSGTETPADAPLLAMATGVSGTNQQQGEPSPISTQGGAVQLVLVDEAAESQAQAEQRIATALANVNIAHKGATQLSREIASEVLAGAMTSEVMARIVPPPTFGPEGRHGASSANAGGGIAQRADGTSMPVVVPVPSDELGARLRPRRAPRGAGSPKEVPEAVGDGRAFRLAAGSN